MKMFAFDQMSTEPLLCEGKQYYYKDRNQLNVLRDYIMMKSLIFSSTKDNRKDKFDDLKGALNQFIAEQKVNCKDREQIAPITFGLEERLTHDLDLQALFDRVKELRHWFNVDKYTRYNAPYFPIVQLSGMGKTRLLVAL